MEHAGSIWRKKLELTPNTIDAHFADLGFVGSEETLVQLVLDVAMSVLMINNTGN